MIVKLLKLTNPKYCQKRYRLLYHGMYEQESDSWFPKFYLKCLSFSLLFTLMGGTGYIFDKLEDYEKSYKKKLNDDKKK
ncbi:hypothetical protein A3Q56_03015 [Intoshia linei]|uniref:Uncharacterized protein n=1 Tax=Intoshia linei TaxID=1819745 RepID=A0A177B4H2_9BILA|nr:hypothetical protein A3Q56_03015 [Intoshia linei]